MELLENLRQFLEQNSLVVLAFLILSLVANCFEIAGYFREKRLRTEDDARRQEEERRLGAYEFIFEAAEKNIKTEDELARLQEEIVRRESAIPPLENRVRLLRLAATKEIVSQNMQRAVDDVRASYDRLCRMRDIHANLGDLPDLPEQEKKTIRAEVEKHTRDPYQLPAAVMYRCLILVLGVLLLPSPADSLLVVVVLGLFLRTFFEVAVLSGEAPFRSWIAGHWQTIGWLSCFGAWFALLQGAEMYLGRPLDLLVDGWIESWRESLPYSERSWALKLLLRRSYILADLAIIATSAAIGTRHWWTMRDAIRDLLGESQ